MALKLSAAPALEPLSLKEVKLHLRVDSDEEDTLIQSLIAAARMDCEKFQNRAYITQTWELWMDSWPDKDFIELPLPPLQEPAVTAGSFVTGAVYRILALGTTNFMLIGAASNTIGAVFTATGTGSGTGTATASCIIKYYGTDNTAYYLDGSKYFVDIKSEPGGVSYGEAWPSTTLRRVNGICITFIAGYGTAENVPENIKSAIKFRLSDLYEFRENIVTGLPLTNTETSEKLLWKDRIL